MRKTDKTAKRVIGVSAMLLVVWSGMFITDYNRCGHLDTPLFVFSVKGEGESYRGFGYEVEVERGEEGTVTSVTMTMFGKVISSSSVE